MPRSARFLAAVLLAAGAQRLSAQTPTPTPSPTPTPPPTTFPVGNTLTIQDSRPVTGVRVETAPDGSLWFLTPSNDRIVKLAGGTMTQWQIRTDNDIGANPVDFELDGNLVWFIETGESRIDAGKSAFARLDTGTGELTEWIVPASRPAGFYRAPDGKVWLPQTAGLLQAVDLTSLEVTDYRADKITFPSDVVVGGDGALWMSDFGSNRIIRYVPGADTETAWTILDPATGFRLNPSQIAFDREGNLWVCELSGGRIDRLNPTTGVLDAFAGFNRPIHFDLFGGKVYVSEAPAAKGRVAILDPNLAGRTTVVITPEEVTVRSLPDPKRATVRVTTIVPTTFTPANDPIPAADLKVSASTAGILRFEFPSTNAYGIEVSGGALWVGSDGKLVRLTPQTIGGANDLVAPVALQSVGPAFARVRVDLTLYNRGSTPISGDALYLASAGVSPAARTFALQPGATALIQDAFASNTGSVAALQVGPVRFRVLSGNSGDLVATVRSSLVRADGATFGIAVPAGPAASLGAGQTRTLFLGTRATETSVFGFFSPAGATATATLVSPAGAVRGTLALSLVSNVAEEFNPAAAAFGVPPEPGDVIRVTVASGSLQPYANVFDPASQDTAVSLPLAASSTSVIPNAGTGVGQGGVLYVSDLFLSNPDTAHPAEVSLSYFPLGAPGTPSLASVSLPPGGSQVVLNLVSSLFGVSAGQGALVVTADRPVVASLKMSARRGARDFSGYAPALDVSASVPSGGAVAIGLPQTATRRTHLFLFNSGAPGNVTVTGFDPAGATIGQLVVPLETNEAWRVDAVFHALGAGDRATGRIRVDASAGMRLYAQTVELDGPTGDPDPSPLR